MGAKNNEWKNQKNKYANRISIDMPGKLPLVIPMQTMIKLLYNQGQMVKKNG